MADRVQFRRDTAVNWYAYNPILLEGEVAYDLDGDQYKVGDGEHAWRDLPYRGLPCVQQKGDSTTTPMSQKAVTDELNNLNERLTPIEEVEIGEYIDSPEFVRLYTIKETNQILWGIQKDGNVYYGAGIPRQIKQYVDFIISRILNGDEGAPEIDSLNKVINFLDGFSTSETLFEILLELDYKKVDKVEGKSLIDEEYAAGVSYIENPEFKDVKLDADGKIIEANYNNGSKLFGAGIKVNGELELQGIVSTTIENLEFIRLILDTDGRITEASRKDGTKVFPAGLETTKENINGVVIETVNNPEYVEARVDSEGKMYFGARRDGDVIVGGVNINEMKRSLDVDAIEVEYNPDDHSIYVTENVNSAIGLEYDSETGDLYQVKDSRITADMTMDENGNVYIEQ